MESLTISLYIPLEYALLIKYTSLQSEEEKNTESEDCTIGVAVAKKDLPIDYTSSHNVLFQMCFRINLLLYEVKFKK